MSEKNEQIKKMIEAMVQKEVRRLLPEAVKQVMAGIINEAVVNLPAHTAAPSAGVNNSHKRRNLQEGSGVSEGYEPYPTMPTRFDRQAMAARAGFEPLGMDLGGIGMGSNIPAPGLITAPAITENGTAVNAEIPDHVLDAFNTDYRGFMKAMGKHKSNG